MINLNPIKIGSMTLLDTTIDFELQILYISISNGILTLRIEHDHRLAYDYDLMEKFKIRALTNIGLIDYVKLDEIAISNEDTDDEPYIRLFGYIGELPYPDNQLDIYANTCFEEGVISDYFFRNDLCFNDIIEPFSVSHNFDIIGRIESVEEVSQNLFAINVEVSVPAKDPARYANLLSNNSIKHYGCDYKYIGRSDDGLLVTYHVIVEDKNLQPIEVDAIYKFYRDIADKFKELDKS
jgi:hypothetical protein